MAERIATCKHCGSEKGFRELGTVTRTVEVSRSVTISADGKVIARWRYIEDDDFDLAGDEMDVDCVRCCECGAEEARIEDLVGTPVHYEPGDLVFCPDGLRGHVAAVDEVARRLSVVGWHEEFSFGEVRSAGRRAAGTLGAAA